MAELSAFEVLGLLKEIGDALRGTYINSIYRLGPSQLFRFRRADTQDIWLVVSPKKGIWVSRQVKERAETTEFTTKLRTELERSRFVGSRQVDLDRIFQLELEGTERRNLIVELMPPGNVIVSDAHDRVVLALHEIRSPGRRLVRGSSYSPPSQTRIGPLEVGSEEVRRMLEQEKTAGAALGRHVAIPRKYVSECLARLGLHDASPSSDMVGRETEVVRVLKEMVEDARSRASPCICETEKGDEIFAFPPKGLMVRRTAGSLSELCDELFLKDAATEPSPVSPAEAKRREMEVTVGRLRSESASLLVEASKLRKAAERARSLLLEDATALLNESGLRPNRMPATPDAIASVLFDQAKRLEAKSAAALESAEKLGRKLPKAGQQPVTRTKPLSKRKQEWYEKFRWFLTGEGKLAVGGRDAQSNAMLLGRHTEGNDSVYHADLYGSPFFVLKHGAEQSESEAREVATATVAFSSAWKTGLGSADAYWVTPEQVSTAAPSGEYLPRGSFAIRGKKNFVNKNIVEVAIGVDRLGKVMAGPESAIRSHCQAYVVLRPYKEKGSDTAKRVLKDLDSMLTGRVPAPSLDDVLRALPSGGGKVVRRGSAPETGV